MNAFNEVMLEEPNFLGVRATTIADKRKQALQQRVFKLRNHKRLSIISHLLISFGF
jgi:hypothetical protein